MSAGARETCTVSNTYKDIEGTMTKYLDFPMVIFTYGGRICLFYIHHY